MPKKGIYAKPVMERNLSFGNIAEAMFRLWSERNVSDLKNTQVVQIGYNPAGTVPVTDKSWLVEESDPDYALARLESSGKPEKVLFGVSVNSQQAPYYIDSTSSGCCSINLRGKTKEERRTQCPQIFDCHDKNPSQGRLWYNAVNIDNDYPRFQAKSGATDTILVTLLSKRPSQVHNWVKGHDDATERQRLERGVWEYLKGGITGATDPAAAEAFLHYLEYSNRKEKPVLTDFGIRWVLMSEITSSKIESWLTGRAYQNGRAMIKYCVPEVKARREAALVAFLRDWDERVGKEGA